MYDDFLQVLDLVKNPDAYTAKVAELVAREQAIQDAIDKLGITGDVVKAQQAADALVVQAQKQLDTANKQAELIVAGAQKAFDKRNSDLQEREVVADQKAADYNTMKATEAARNEALRVKEKELTALQQQLESRQAELNVKQAEVEVRLDKLRQVMG